MRTFGSLTTTEDWKIVCIHKELILNTEKKQISGGDSFKQGVKPQPYDAGFEGQTLIPPSCLLYLVCAGGITQSSGSLAHTHVQSRVLAFRGCC